MTDDAAPAAHDPATTGGGARFRVDDGDLVIVHVEGEVDASNGPELQRLLDRAFSTGPELVIVDVSELGFIDSVGLSVLVTAHNRGAETGIGFQIRDLPASCRRVFEITGLADVLDLR